MDTSDKYANMCRAAYKLQDAWKPQEGDYIMTPDGVKVIGTDIFGVVKYFRKVGRDRVLHIPVPNETMVWEKDPNFNEMSVKTHELRVHKYSNPYCLFKQDQLWGMLDSDWIDKQVGFYDYLFETASDMCAECFKNKGLEDVFAGWKDGEHIYDTTVAKIKELWDSFEIALICFVMYALHENIWSDDRQSWVKEEEK